MENKAFIFEERESQLNANTFQTRDYFSYYYGGIEDLVRENFNFFEFIKMNNDDKLEIIAYDRYGSENYADVIVMINKANFIWMIPYNSDIVISIADTYNDYLTLSINNSNDKNKAAFIDTYSERKAQIENDEKITILVPKIANIQDVISLIDGLRESTKDVQGS